MRGKNRIQWYSVVLLAFLVASCQVKRPENVTSDAKMENVLYDYHIAKAMGEELSHNENYKRLLYIESVFKKHNITQAIFDSSMVWYARNPEVLTKIYERLNLRLKAERDGINHLIAIRDNKPQESLPGDSVNVWAWQHIYKLTGMPLNNRIAFTLPSDSNFHARDTLRWSMRFRFYNSAPDSAHIPLMAMQILYENDSIISKLQMVKETGIETISLTSDTLGKIKEIRGFVYYPLQESSRSLLIDRISLMRYHATDTLSTVSSDSILQDTIKIKENVIKEKPTEVKKDSNLNRRRENLRLRPSLQNNKQ